MPPRRRRGPYFRSTLSVPSTHHHESTTQQPARNSSHFTPSLIGWPPTPTSKRCFLVCPRRRHLHPAPTASSRLRHHPRPPPAIMCERDPRPPLPLAPSTSHRYRNRSPSRPPLTILTSSSVRQRPPLSISRQEDEVDPTK